MNSKCFGLLLLACFAAAYLCLAGCSAGMETQPIIGTIKDAGATATHQLFGLYQFAANPEKNTLDITPLRSGAMHLNALVFLEPPALVNLTLEYLEFGGNKIIADIGLRHPFLGLTEFSGFDVCGVLITNGSITGFQDADIRMAGKGDTRLLNPDGYTRWWNPAEFPHLNTMFGYKDGLLGAPDSAADFNCTINGYKYYADGLEPTVNYLTTNISKRGLFSAGSKNVRRFEIELGSEGLIFNYAVDACWQFPGGSPPWQAPDDFPPAANRAEAWGAKVTETANTLYNDGAGHSGGNLSLSINVYDHFNAGLNNVRVESPGNFTPVNSSVPVGGGSGFSTYQIDITGATPAQGSIKLLITVECEASGYQDVLPGIPQATYFTHTSTVSLIGPANPVTGNVKLETIRDVLKIITGMKISWTSNGSPEYAIYADTDPYGGLDNFTTLVGTTPAVSLTFNSTTWPAFKTNAAYAFTVRARAIAGSAASESTDSEYCFCELDDFESGTAAGGGTWISRSHNPTIQFADSTGPWTVHGGGVFSCENLRLSYTEWNPVVYPYTNWICIISPQLPDISSHEEARYEFNIHYQRLQAYPPDGYGNFGDVRVVGCCLSPPANGSYPIDFDISGPDTTNWRAGFHYDWPSIPTFPVGKTVYEVYGAPSTYDNTLGYVYWHAPLTEYTQYAAWSFNESFDTLEGYADGRRYVGIGFARAISMLNDDCYHHIAYDDMAVIIY